MTETYSLSVDFGGNINIKRLTGEIDDDGTITTALSFINVSVSSADNVDIDFVAPLSAPEKTALDTVVANHNSTPFSGSIFVAYDTTGGLNIDSGYTPIVWDTIEQIDNIYSHSTSDITFNVSGNYDLLVQIPVDALSGALSSNSTARLMMDTGTGFKEVTATRSYATHEGVGAGFGILTISTCLVNINRNDIIRVEAMRLKGSTSLGTITGGRIFIHTSQM
jgi:hypothetical protein